jgi:hypothetical protein
MKAERTATNVLATTSRTSWGERTAKMMNALKQTTTRRSKPLAVCSVVFATMAWTASAAAQSFSYNSWQTWDSGGAPNSQSTTGNVVVKVTNGNTHSGSVAWFIEASGPAGWTAMERTFQPPAGKACTAFAAVSPGSHIASSVRLGVIDKPSWSYVVTNDFVINDPETHTFGDYYWKSASWTSNGNQVVLRVLVYGVPGATYLYADDFVVQCAP